MTTNILATLLTLLVTNIHEHVETGRFNPWVYAINPPPAPQPLPDLKHRTTEIHEQRLLILEAEGITFTNIIKSTRTLWKSETFVAKALEPQWEIDTNKTIVDDGKNHWPNTGTIESLIVTNKTLLYIGTNKWDKDKP